MGKSLEPTAAGGQKCPALQHRPWIAMDLNRSPGATRTEPQIQFALRGMTPPTHPRTQPRPIPQGPLKTTSFEAPKTIHRPLWAGWANATPPDVKRQRALRGPRLKGLLRLLLHLAGCPLGGRLKRGGRNSGLEPQPR